MARNSERGVPDVIHLPWTDERIASTQRANFLTFSIWETPELASGSSWKEAPSPSLTRRKNEPSLSIFSIAGSLGSRHVLILIAIGSAVSAAWPESEIHNWLTFFPCSSVSGHRAYHVHSALTPNAHQITTQTSGDSYWSLWLRRSGEAKGKSYL